MPRVLGIDSSLTGTGLCRVDINVAGHSGGKVFDGEMKCLTVGAPKPKLKTKREYSRRISVVIDCIEACLEGVDQVAIEALAYGAQGSANWVLPWLFGRVIDLCEAHDIPLITVATASRAKYATGSGNMGKDVVMLAANKLWPQAAITNNNEADAAVVAAIGCRHLGFPIDIETKYRLEVMDKVSD